MSIGLTEDHEALASSIRGFVARHAPSTAIRADLDAYAAGAPFPGWDGLVELGLTSLHLPEEHGGAGAGYLELAVALEETARGLLPGHLLPSVLTSGLLAANASDEVRKRTLPALAAGTRAASALTADGPRATPRSDGGHTVSGATVPVLGAAGAELLLLGARVTEDGAGAAGAARGTAAGSEVWFVVDAATPGVRVEAADAVDLTRGVARVHLDAVGVGAEQVVALSTERVRTLAAVLFAAEAVGIARWLLTTGVEYVKVREQFGRPVGSFQAVKHRAARMLVRTETMTAAAWDAARAVEQGDEQLALAAAEAAILCLAGATELGLETVTLLGGIGYTWEHDTHLYWRRAMTLESLLGPVAAFEHRLGELVASSGSASLEASEDATEEHSRASSGLTRDFDLELPEEDPAFRARIAGILNEVAALPDGERQSRLADEGLVLPHYPRPYGLAASPVEQIVIQQEYERSGVAQPKTVIGEWAMPTVLAHGTEEQKRTLIPATLRGEITWCQLFSEPGAGSDLAALSTRAEKVEGGWRINGQKVWNSMADRAHYGVLLARTNQDAPKHRGISYFLLDMRTPGIEVRPLREANGHYLFNEVFLGDVLVPDDRLVGEVDKGWALARTTLGNERVAMGGMRELRLDMPAMAASGELAARADDVRRDIGALYAHAYALSAMSLRGTLRTLSGLRPGAEASVAKVAASFLNTDVATRTIRWFGPAAASADGPGAAAVHQYLSVPPHLIGGGTIEIQLNVIAERVLGLPRG
ncbi:MULTISPECIES: acyl-CoA dehydrogenase [unclassified Pseudofrankia]|uniref:acyl-CoA dehydrogenase n=1 Tax=unclassified Pseudofrankia TaxID=2994372 RepID=UPI0008D99EC6|nr:MULTISPECIES: acyl-CoA dehydrogenase [unclassified Pseudofrankia]MDT3441734.1 acyl-CoA dehydrogenase [Pseudofrankia sp. BMG5.37]OHV47052.1 acyl-CoA dehydrogenase [Pseudofrankia sp. BMG5.36]